MLSVYLEPFERAIAFQVTNQDDQITSYLKRVGTFTASNGWKVTISVGPELDIRTKTIFLRGADANRNKRVDRTWDLTSNSNRDLYIQAADVALQELTNAASGIDSFSTSTEISPFLTVADNNPRNSGVNYKPMVH